MRDVVIVAAKRTAIGTFGGGLSSLRADQLGTTVIKALLEETGVAGEQVNEVLLGQVLTAGCGQNPARQSAVNAGLPLAVPAMTINKVCGSGLKAVHLAVQAIRCGDAELIIAGGQESMSLAPHVLPNSRKGQRMGNWSMVDTMINDGLWDAFNDYHMGITAENIVEKFGITREEQDAFAAASQQKAVAAQKAGRFSDEIVPVEIPQRKGEPVIVDTDEGPRDGVTTEGLAKLRPAFKKDGTVTAGNASSLNDGAAAVMVCSADKAKELGLTPLVTIKAHASALVEANEAFAAQAISVNRELGWDTSKVNVNGGAIALGHPIGASGCRILVSLIHEMVRRDSHKGLATLCIGGGMGVALAVER